MRSSLFLAFAFWDFTWGAFLGKAVRAHPHQLRRQPDHRAR